MRRGALAREQILTLAYLGKYMVRERVFISHIHEEAELAKLLKEFLNKPTELRSC